MWTGPTTELLRNQLTSRAMEVVDWLAAHPGHRFESSELVRHLGLDSDAVLRGLLGELTKAAWRAGLEQSEPHSLFIEWTDSPTFRYWLTQTRADWWTGSGPRRFRALAANPTSGYDILCALKTYETDWWMTKGSDLSVGDRVAIWKTLGGPDYPKERGVVAFGEIVSEPQVRQDPGGECWAKGSAGGDLEERVEVRYYPLPEPLWISGPASATLNALTVSRMHGGTVFNIEPPQWENLLHAAGGWPGPKAPQRGAWAAGEIRDTVKAYLTMLLAELNGEPYSKSNSRRTLLPKLSGRSEGAIEFKHQNISAVMDEFGLPFLKGYKPRWNFQNALRDELRRQLADDQNLRTVLQDVAEAPPGGTSVSDSPVFVKPPTSGKHRTGTTPRRGTHIDYAGREEHNAALGHEGETFVISVEKQRLVEAGKPELAELVRWVSQKDGDGLGYDVQSYDEAGKPIFIEVKTTRRGIYAGFFLTRTEVQASREFGEAFRLYRVFGFDSEPQIYVLTGPLEENCEMHPITYKAWVTG